MGGLRLQCGSLAIKNIKIERGKHCKSLAGEGSFLLSPKELVVKSWEVCLQGWKVGDLVPVFLLQPDEAWGE